MLSLAASLGSLIASGACFIIFSSKLQIPGYFAAFA
jgi:hypothetical protein